MRNIEVNENTAKMLDIIEKCDDLQESLTDMIDGFDILPRYRDEIGERMRRRVSKIRNEVIGFLGDAIYGNFIGSGHKSI